MLILVSGARPEKLRPLERTLLDIDSDLQVCLRPESVLDAAEGSTVLLYVHESDGLWLNIKRPIFVERR